MIGITDTPTPQGNTAAPETSAEAPLILQPFVRAAQRTRLPFHNQATTVTSSSTQVGPVDIPAQGFLRGIHAYVTATGGAGGSGDFTADGPWNAIQDLSIQDINGRPIFGPMSGFDCYIVDKWGGYNHPARVDPADWSSYSIADEANGNFTFHLYIPIEISAKDGLGSLANLTSSATYKLFYTVAAEGTLFATSPLTTLPDIRVKLWADVWSQPNPKTMQGRANETAPPMLGTTQFWSKSTVNVVAGENRIRLTRMGNMLRNVLLLYRDDAATPARSTSEFPDDWRLELDAKILTQTGKILHDDDLNGAFNEAPDTGFIALYVGTDDQDGMAGNENRHQWLPTTSGTRLEFVGTFTGTGGTLTILYNDIAVPGDVRLDSGGF